MKLTTKQTKTKPIKTKKPVEKPKIRSIKNANRAPREFVPTSKRPDAFYKGSRFGYSFCDECKTENINVLIGVTLTCGAGHVRTLSTSNKVEPKEIRLEGVFKPSLFLV